MKVVIIYRPKSEHARTVETFVQEYRHRHAGARLEVIDIDSRDGRAMASLYDVMQYPTILALRDDGSVMQEWAGERLPMMDELAYYSLDGAPETSPLQA